MAPNSRPPPQHGIKLAAHIISTDFGNLVAKVCECLLRRGCLGLAQISKFIDLPQDKVKKCLWVLIQHNCVQPFALEQEGGARETTLVVTQYMALFDNIIHRLRFAKFMTIVSKELDKEASEILEGLLQHGRLTLPQVLDRAMDAPSKGSEASRDDYNERFVKLVRSRFVERCPAAEPLIPLPTEDEASKKQRSTKIARKEVVLEDRVLAAAMLMGAERFSISSDDGVNFDLEENETNLPCTKVGEKRKQDFLESSGDPDLMGGTKEPVWRVNFDEFINRLRIKACVEYTRAEYSDTEALIMKSMLDGTKSTEDRVSMSLASIYEAVTKSEEGHGMDSERVRFSLEQLHFCSEEDGVYNCKLKDIIEKAQLEEVESIVLKRYGNGAFRIFRSLSTSRSPLDTDKIGEKTLMDKKETPQILYRLWQDNFIHMEKITTGGHKQTDVVLWSRKIGNVWHKVLDELYHAALNLSLRCAHEQEKDREILNLPKSKKDKNPELKLKVDRLKKVYLLLESSLMKLDDSIMLLHDFVV